MKIRRTVRLLILTITALLLGQPTIGMAQSSVAEIRGVLAFEPAEAQGVDSVVRVRFALTLSNPQADNWTDASVKIQDPALPPDLAVTMQLGPVAAGAHGAADGSMLIHSQTLSDWLQGVEPLGQLAYQDANGVAHIAEAALTCLSLSVEE